MWLSSSAMTSTALKEYRYLHLRQVKCVHLARLPPGQKGRGVAHAAIHLRPLRGALGSRTPVASEPAPGRRTEEAAHDRVQQPEQSAAQPRRRTPRRSSRPPTRPRSPAHTLLSFSAAASPCCG